MSTETIQILTTIKKLLKNQGMTYRDVARALKLSEPSVKRLFSSGSLTVDRLVELSHLVGYTLAELSKEAAATQAKLDTLAENQERELVSDPKLLVVAVCALNHWTLEDIAEHYRITGNECLKYLLRLDKLRIIDLLPGNRIRINVSRDFEWLPTGPIRQYFQARGQGDFLKSAFNGENESMAFAHGMLTAQALSEMQGELRRLRQKFATLHEESLSAPLSERYGIGLMLAMRRWEPADFAALKRK